MAAMPVMRRHRGDTMSFHPDSFQIISRITPGPVTMAVRGEVDLATAPELRRQMTDRLAHASTSTLHLDLSGVSFMDSSGLLVLLGAQRRARLLGGDVVLTRTSPQVARLLDLAGVPFSVELPTEVPALKG